MVKSTLFLLFVFVMNALASPCDEFLLPTERHLKIVELAEFLKSPPQFRTALSLDSGRVYYTHVSVHDYCQTAAAMMEFLLGRNISARPTGLYGEGMKTAYFVVEDIFGVGAISIAIDLFEKRAKYDQWLGHLTSGSGILGLFATEPIRFRLNLLFNSLASPSAVMSTMARFNKQIARINSTSVSAPLFKDTIELRPNEFESESARSISKDELVQILELLLKNEAE